MRTLRLMNQFRGKIARSMLWVGMAVAIGVGCVAEDLHGNDALTATPVATDGELVTGCIDEAGDRDFFLFTAQGARRYILQSRRLSPEMRPVLFLLGSDGETILRVATDAGEPETVRLEWLCETTGTYFVMVRHALSTSGTGCYELSIGAVQADDHGDTPLEATPVHVTDGTTPGFLEAAGDVDVFLFQADAAYAYTIGVLNLVGGVDPAVLILGVDGETVLAEAAAEAAATSLEVNWTAQATGAHFLVVRSASGQTTGSYDLYVRRGGYGDDHGNVWSDAASLPTDGSPVAGRIEVAGDTDVFAVQAREGGQYTVSIASTDGEAEFAATLLAADGSTALAGSVRVAEGVVEIDWTAPADGVYYLEVRHALGTGSGPYAVSVQSVLQLADVGGFNPQGGYTLDVAVDDDLAYLIVGSKGLLVVDVSDPEEPQEIGSHSTPGYSQALAVNGRYLYMANRGDGISILDLSDPSRPHELGRYDTMGSAQDVVVRGSLAYVADQRGGLLILDVSRPSSPELVGSWATRGYAEAVTVCNGVAYVATGDVGLELVDVSEPESPQGLSEIDLPGEAHAVVVYPDQDVAYVAAGYRGIRVIDVSEPASPLEVAAVATAGEAHGLYLAGTYLYVADYTEGLAVFSLATADAPRPVARVDTPGYAVGVVVTPSAAYVADREAGLRILALYP